MNWFNELFTDQTSFMHAVLILSLISAVGLTLGHVKIKGISLGVTFVFFTGIIAGHFGTKINPEMLALAQNFGLILYIWGLVHWDDPEGWYGEGGGRRFRIGNTCTPVADACLCMTKPIQYCKLKRIIIIIK